MNMFSDMPVPVMIFFGILVLGVFILLVALVWYFIQFLREVFTSPKKLKYSGNMEYWREPPKATPAAAALLDDRLQHLHGFILFDHSGDDSVESAMFASTIMSLCTKNAIEVHEGESALLFTPVTQENKVRLCDSEQVALELMEYVYTCSNQQPFTMEQVEQVLKADKKAQTLITQFDQNGHKEFDDLKMFHKGSTFVFCSGLITLFFAFTSIFYAEDTTYDDPPTVKWIICGFLFVLAALCFVFGGNVRIRDQSKPVFGHVIGYHRYLKDFGNFTDRDVIQVKLWGPNMVYATAFGMTRKALHELHVPYTPYLERKPTAMRDFMKMMADS